VAGRFGWRDAILAEQQVDDFGRRFRSQFGRDGDRGLGAAVKIGGEGGNVADENDALVKKTITRSTSPN
jgi:hypothetical protein